MQTVKLNYKEIGTTGKPLIILHGLFGTLDNWLTIGKYFGDNGYHVFLLDQRNHGRSPHSDDWNYDYMAADLNHFIQEQSIENPFIIGHSMGGKTVMKFATTYKHLAQKIIVADISPRYYAPHHQEILNGFNSVNTNEISSRTDADKSMSTIIKDIGVRQFLLKNLQRTENGFEWKVNLDIISQNIQNVGEALKETETSDIETLFIKGSKSDYITEVDFGIIKKHFPNSTIATVDNAGHWLHAEQPKEFIKHVENFLNA